MNQSNSGFKLLLNRLIEEVINTNKKLDTLIKLNNNSSNKQSRKSAPSNHSLSENKLQLDVMSLLSLPMSLRKTAMVLYKLEKATAKDLAKETNRLRAVESASANQLTRMGYVKKKREGRNVYFYIESHADGKKQWEEQ